MKWTDHFFHDDKGKIEGEISSLAYKYKALIGNEFIGWYVSETYAKKAVEEAYEQKKADYYRGNL